MSEAESKTPAQMQVTLKIKPEARAILYELRDQLTSIERHLNDIKESLARGLHQFFEI